MRVDIELLRKTMKHHGLTNENVGKALGVSRDGFQRRLRDKSFRIAEVHTLIQVIPLTKAEVWKIFFAE